MWADSSKEFAAPVSKGKRVLLCHDGSTEGFADNALHLRGKGISKCYLDYHQNINGEVFESWFGDKLIQNFRKGRKTLIVLNNAKYHCRPMEKHIFNEKEKKKNGMIEVMKKHNTTIPEPIPAKPLLLSLVGEANVPKQYIVDNNAKTSGYSVLQLSPYHCMLHPIEIVWSQTKQHYRRQNIYSNEPSNILESI